jgi:archaellum component FlaC
MSINEKEIVEDLMEQINELKARLASSEQEVHRLNDWIYDHTYHTTTAG